MKTLFLAHNFVMSTAARQNKTIYEVSSSMLSAIPTCIDLLPYILKQDLELYIYLFGHAEFIDSLNTCTFRKV